MEWRNLAESLYRAMLKKANKKNPKAKTFQSSFSTFFYGKKDGKKEIEAPSDSASSTLSIEEMKNLHDSLMQTPATSAAAISSDSIISTVMLKLDSLSLDLVGSNFNLLTRLKIENVYTLLQLNADESKTITTRLTELTVLDHATPNTIYPEVLHATNSGAGSSSAAVSFDFHQTADHTTVKLKLMPYQIIIPAPFLLSLRSFLDIAPPNPAAPPPPTLEKSTMSASYDLFYEADQFLPADTPAPSLIDTAGEAS